MRIYRNQGIVYKNDPSLTLQGREDLLFILGTVEAEI